MVGDIKTAALEDYRGGVEKALRFAFTFRASGFRFGIKILFLVKTVAARATLIFINRHIRESPLQDLSNNILIQISFRSKLGNVCQL
jgi:hypothetical protein